jgi:hypothetical protein
MVVGSLAGVAVLYELVWLAHHQQLGARLRSPDNVWIAAACVFVFGWGLALVAPKVARWLFMFTLAGAWAAASIAASAGEHAYAVPLLGVGLAAALAAAASFKGDRQMRRARTA